MLRLLCISLICAFCMPILAQQAVRSLSVEDVLSYRLLSQNQEFSVSHDGALIAYTLRSSDRQAAWTPEDYEVNGVPAHASGSSVWVVNTRTGDNVQVSPKNVNSWAPVWSFDSRTVAYISDRDPDGKARIWLHNLDTWSERRASPATVLGGYAPRWVSDGKALLAEALPERARSSAADHGRKDSADATVKLYSSVAPGHVEQPPWSIDQGQGSLVLIDVQTSQALDLAPDTRVANFSVSPDLKLVAFTIAKRFARPGSQQQLFDVFVVSFQDRQVRPVAHNIRLPYNGGPLTWSPNSDRIAYLEDGPDGIGNGFVIDVTSGRSCQITFFRDLAASPYLSGGLLWDRSSQWLYFRYRWTLWRARSDGSGARLVSEIPSHQLDPIAIDGNLAWEGHHSVIVATRNADTKACGIFRVSTDTGHYAEVLERNQTIGSFLCLANGMVVTSSRRLVFRSQDAVHSEELWISDSTLQQVRPVTHANPQFERMDLGSARLIEWQSIDGRPLHGSLLLPPGYRPDRRYALVVWVYGGSSLSDHINVFGIVGNLAGAGFLHLFTTRDYAVLVPDAPVDVSQPMFDIFKAVMPGVQKVIDMGVADSASIGIMGHSFGGYSAISLVAQTTRFKAAAVSAGFADRLLVYGAMNDDGAAYGVTVEEANAGVGLGGTPWEFQTRYIDNSPIFYFNRIVTPILLLHGTRDTTVPATASDQMFVSLRRLGKTVQYARYEGEEHSPATWSHSHQRDYLDRIVRWFAKYLSDPEEPKGERPTSETFPPPP
jgi:dipeptidyl aminopeptidase/acylaminoacyl peptidase